jgi:RimJ/RimL family protein N-acetyltransferase
VLLATERLVLRRFRPADAGTLAEYRSDPEVARYQSWDPPLALEEARELVAVFAAGEPDGAGWFQYAIERTADHAHLGDVGVNLHEDRRRAEVGFTLARAYQGQGYAFEAVHAVLGRLFAVPGLHRVSAECDARNTASARLLGRLGFTAEGRSHTGDLLFGLHAADLPEPR